MPPLYSGYCSQILGWFPPLVFSIMVQNNINMKWALTVVASIFAISIFFLCLCGPWEAILDEARTATAEIIPVSDGEDEDDENNGEAKSLDNTDPENN